MKLKFEIEIEADINDVWSAFNNPANMRRWMQNFHSFTQTSGEPGQPGAVAELVFDENGKKVVLKETVTERREPDLLAARYESPHGSTIIVNHFESPDDNRTRWSSWCNFTFTGFMKYISFLIARVIRKRTEGDMQRFKLMLESDLAGADR